MANASRDNNRVTTLLGVTDDGSLTSTRLIVDPTTKRLKVSAIITSGGGITSLNGVTTGSQSLIAGNAGTDFTIDHGTYHTFNLPNASAANRGLLLSADWTTFNNKVGTARTVATTSPLAGGGDLSADRTLTIGGLSTFGTGHWIVGVNPAASALEYKQFLGTTNQITITQGTNVQTFSTPQDIHTGAVLTFGTLTLTNIAGTAILSSDDAGIIRKASIGTSLSLSSNSLNTIQGIRTTDNPTFNAVTHSGTAIFNTGAVFDGEVANGNSGATFTIDWGAGNKQALTLTGSCTLTFTAPAGATNLLLRATQSNGSAFQFIYPASVKISGGTALTTGTNSIDIVSFYYNPTSGSYLGVRSADFV